MNNFYKEALEMKDELIFFRRYIHMNPELGMEEENTSKFIKEFLDKENISYKTYAKTGVCGIIEGTLDSDLPKRVIGVRADMDALPMEEKNICEYASRVKGRMHACGHDGHTAILMGVAKILNKNKHLFSGKVVLVFEPAEETVGGASIMIEEGMLEELSIDVMCALHMDETLDCGKVRVSDKLVNAASNPFSVKIIGRGGHGAYPSRAIDPVVVTSNVICGLQNIISREVSPVNSALISVGKIHGGSAPNIIPNEVKFEGIIRTVTNEDREFVINRFKQVVKGISSSFNCDSDIYVEDSYPCLINNSSMVSIFRKASEDVVGCDNVYTQESPKMGVESFAYFARKVPSVFYFLGCRNEEKGIIHSAHNPLFDLDEDCLPIGVAIQCEVVLRYMLAEAMSLK